jgi:hypothetical protein
MFAPGSDVEIGFVAAMTQPENSYEAFVVYGRCDHAAAVFSHIVRW